MRYGSICSGIEAASVAWHPLGWEPAWFSEIDTFPSAVLNHRFPGVPNHGDFTQILRDESHPSRSVPIDVLVGGTPCQAFSVAGLRRGFDDDRGNLTLEFCRLVGLLRPRWVVWENVPGVLSIDGGRAFGSILGAFRELGYGFAYRILDAQHFGVPQRRRRIFLVGHSGGDWRAPATVLFEPEGVFGNPPPSAKTRKVAPRSTGNGAPSDSQRVMRRVAIGEYTTAGAHSVNAVEDGTPTLKCESNGWGPLSVAFRANMGGNDGAVYEDGTCGTLTGNTQPAVTLIRESGQGYWMEDAVAGTVDAHVGMSGSGALRPGVLAFRPAYFLREGASGAPSEISGTVLASNAKNGDTADHVFAFRPSHYTRGKDGAPSEVTPPLSADADKGDQDTVVLARTVALRGREGGYTAELGDDKANALRAGDGGGSKAFVFCDVYNGKIDGEVAATLTIAAGTSANHSGPTILSFAENQRGDLRESETSTALTSGGGKPGQGYPAVRVDHPVRRLTPVECEKLQGFPDGWTQVPFRNKPAADGPRYKALGNSMAVPVMRWIGSRIAKVDALQKTPR
jgi:DNA (cytosine-5)-methyltransferase 1